VFGPEKSILLADLVAVVHDASNVMSKNKLDPRLRSVLEKFPQKSSILILNKVCLVEKNS
jgi:predicted GTPase